MTQDRPVRTPVLARPRLRVRLIPVGERLWHLTLDRTNGPFGQADIHFPVLAIAYRSIVLPVFQSVLDKAGNSNTDKRIARVQRFLDVFGTGKVAALLADREFVGEHGFMWQQANPIPFHQRLKRDTRSPNAWNRLKRADPLLGSLTASGDTCRIFNGGWMIFPMGFEVFVLY